MRSVALAVLMVACSKPSAPSTSPSSDQAPSSDQGPSTDAALPDVTMAHYVWSKRPLLLFAPNDSSSLGQVRRTWDAVASDMQERDMVLLEVVGDEVRQDGRVIGSATSLRRRFDPEPPLTMVLVGKDGDEKMRGNNLSPSAVFSTIDAMPMRQREMKTH